MSSIQLALTRDLFTIERSMGVLLYNAKPFGWTVEDPDRGLDEGMSLEDIAKLKIPRKTCIATGMHPIVLQDSSNYGPDTLTILTPGHRVIRIHSGFDEDDTDGCLCPGTKRTDRNVSGSKNAVRWLHNQMVPHLRNGGDAWIRIGRDPVAWASAPFNPNRIAA